MKLLWCLAMVVAGLSLVVMPVETRAQAPSGLRIDITDVRDGEFPEGRAVANVDDSSGGDVSALTAANFKVTLDGKPATVRSAELASKQHLPLDVLFVVDVSGSMAGEPLARTKEAASGFLSGLDPADRVALLAFADDVQLVQDYTTDRALLASALDGLTASGNTALYQATANTAIKLTTSQASRRAVIFLSDGAQDGVPLTIPSDKAIEAAAGVGVPFFTIGEGKGIDRDFLQQLAQVTHGRYLEAPDPKNLGALYAGIGNLLRSQYVVTFDASSVPHDGAAMQIEVTASGVSASATSRYTPAADFGLSAITIEGLRPGESIDSSRTITVRSNGPASSARASFLVDGVNVFETEKAPYKYVYDPRSFGTGEHTLSVSVRSGARSTEASVAFSSSPPAPAPSKSLPVLPIVIGGGIGVAAAIVFLVVLRLRVSQRGEAPNAERVVPFSKPILSRGLPPPEVIEEDAVPAEEVGELLGVLISRGGSDLGAEYGVGGSPVSIGSGSRCAVRVRDAELTAEEARIWIRKGHLMVHKMTRLTAMVVDGTSGGWEILEPGDTFQIGRHSYEFRLLPAAVEAPEDAAGSAPTVNVLRDDAPPGSPVTESRRPNLTDLMPRSE